MFGADAIFPALLVAAAAIALFIGSAVGFIAGLLVIRRAPRLGIPLLASSLVVVGTMLAAYVSIQKAPAEYEITADLRDRHDKSWLPRDVSESVIGPSEHFSLSGVIGLSFSLPDGARLAGNARSLFVRYTEGQLRTVGFWLDDSCQKNDLEARIDSLVSSWDGASVPPDQIESLRNWLVAPATGNNTLTFVRDGYRVYFRISGPGFQNTYRIYCKLDFES